jgi:hypothetical protein
MAELVDALGSGPSDGNIVEVRVFFRAPKYKKIAKAVFFVCAAVFTWAETSEKKRDSLS